MRKLLLRNLLITLFLSFVLSIVLFIIYHAASRPGFEEGQALFLIFTLGEIFQHLLLFLFALPVLSISQPVQFANTSNRLIYYFGGPVALTILSILILTKDEWTPLSLLLLIPNFTFLSIHTMFYFRLPKDQQV